MTTTAKRIVPAVLAAFAMAVAMMFALSAPQQAEAKTITKGSYVFYTKAAVGGVGPYASSVKTTSKKITFKGAGYKITNSGLKQVKSGTYTFKINSKTKFENVAGTDTGAFKKISKKSGLKKLKKKQFIGAYLVVKSGKVKSVLFGV